MPVNDKHPDYRGMEKKWTRCRDAACGQDAVHDAGEKYLPKLKDQTPEDYTAYKTRAVFYNATWRTIAGLVGMVFRKPPVLEAPKPVLDMADDITLSGVPLQLFAENVVEEALKCGRLGLLVDYPTVEPGAATTLADTKSQNLRPMMGIYTAEQCINWRTARINNVTVLSMVVLEETVDEMADEFASKKEKRWRVLDLDASNMYRVRMYKIQLGSAQPTQFGADILPMKNGARLDYIPFTFISADDSTPEVDDPPLIDLVDMNLSHYRVTADLEHGAHFTGLPTPWIAGYTPDKEGEKLYIGSSHAWVFKDPQAKAEYLEFKGEGLGALERSLDRKEKQMAVLGARMLEQQKRASESADSQSIHRKGEESMLSMASQSISLGMTKALKWFADWAGEDPSKVKYELNRDFYPVPMTADMMNALVAGWQAGAFSDQVLFDNLKAGDVIDESTTLEQEQARLADAAPNLAGSPGGVPGQQPKPGEKQGMPAAAPKKSMTVTGPSGSQYHIKEN